MPQRTALLVEPDATSAKKLGALLESVGFGVDVVAGGDAACTRLTNRRYDLVVTELSLTGVDGFAVIDCLRRRATPEQTRAVVVSPFVALRTAASQQKREKGIDAVVAKNGPVETAVRAVKKLFPEAKPDAARAPGRADDEHVVDVVDFSDEGIEIDASLDEGALDVLVGATVVDGAGAREEARLAAVREAKGDVDAPPPDRLQALTADVARALGVKSAVVSLIDDKRQWWKGYAGVEGRLKEERGTPRELSFCRHVVEADTPEPLVVPDAAVHPVFMKNPLVVDGTVRSYAGAPLITAEGQVLGTLCVFDGKPSQLAQKDVDRLVVVARHVAGLIAVEAAQKKQAEARAALAARLTVVEGERASVTAVATRLSAVLEGLDSAVLLVAGPARTVVYANAAAGEFFGADAAAFVGKARSEFVDAVAALSDDDVRAVLAIPDEGPWAGSAVFTVARPRARVLRWSARPVVVDGVVAQLVTFTDLTAEAQLARLRQEQAVQAALASSQR